MACAPIRSTHPQLEKVHFLKDSDDRFGDPVPTWEKCVKLQSLWNEDWSKNEELKKRMVAFRKQRAINMVWVSNKLEGTLPEGISQMQTYHILEKLFDGEECTDSSDSCDPDSGRDSEKNRETRPQIKQHFQAFMYLNEIVSSEPKQELSEEIIKCTHKILMDGLLLEDSDIAVPAGVYRTKAVHAGPYSFPSHDSVPGSMKRVVEEYNMKSSEPNQDAYELAGWLLYRVVSIHPFMDGNGRLCRLLWCFSLLRDGLPFPLTISSGHEKAHKHYVRCIELDRRRPTSKRGHLTTLTVVSILNQWDHFIANLEFEAPEEYKYITSQLEEEDY